MGVQYIEQRTLVVAPCFTSEIGTTSLQKTKLQWNLRTRDTLGLNSFVPCREVVPISEGPLSEVPLFTCRIFRACEWSADEQ